VSEFCYTTVPGKIKTLMGKLREVGVPKKVTVQWLKRLGFTSSNDSSLVGVLKQIDLVDSTNVPTARWTHYRGADHKKVLGEAIRHGYADLYAVYPDAHQRSQTDLDHVFSTQSSGGKQVITKTISTFKSLVELADFSSSGSVQPAAAPTPAAPADPAALVPAQRDLRGHTCSGRPPWMAPPLPLGRTCTSTSRFTSRPRPRQSRSRRSLKAWLAICIPPSPSRLSDDN
jgi:hypothetical protein